MTDKPAAFALRVIHRSRDRGVMGVIWRYYPEQERLTALSPLAFTASLPMVKDACRGTEFAHGSWHGLDADWGARLACYAIVSRGLSDGERLQRAAHHFHHADGNEAAWWLVQLTCTEKGPAIRALRALRILTEAVE